LDDLKGEKLIEMCFQLLAFVTIQFLDLSKANKKLQKATNKHPLRSLHKLQQDTLLFLRMNKTVYS
jgi:hypothetical protein